MALRQIMLGKKIEKSKENLRSINEKMEALILKEKELEKAIEEVETDEEEKTVEEEIEKFNNEKSDVESEKLKIEAEIEKLEEELESIEEDVVDETVKEENNKERGKGKNTMIKRGIFEGMTHEERNSFVKNADIKDFLERVRSLRMQNRAITGADLTIPDVALGLLRDNLHKYSKLVSLVYLKKVQGTARQNIAGVIPEGVWTEAVSRLNELEIEFNQVEVDGYKVGGYIPIPNSTLEDSDVNLASEIMYILGQAIGVALDKAIIYGTGKKMPTGFITRLAQTTKPADWNTNAPEWKNLSTTNIQKFAGSTLEGPAFFAKLIKILGTAKANYSNGEKIWIMNSTTEAEIMSKAITFNSAGAVVAKVNGEMPIIGGKIIILDFMSDYDIAGGYGSLYLLAERKGGTFAKSEHVMFIDDQTVFKGTARYDGLPVLGEGFVIVNTNNVAPTTTMAFAGDTPVEG